jgi:hypothetical protein
MVRDTTEGLTSEGVSSSDTCVATKDVEILADCGDGESKARLRNEADDLVSSLLEICGMLAVPDASSKELFGSARAVDTSTELCTFFEALSPRVDFSRAVIEAGDLERLCVSGELDDCAIELRLGGRETCRWMDTCGLTIAWLT